MPFETDTTWPPGLLTIFDHCRARNTFESRYYGPYDKLLNYCFGDSFTYYVAPQNPSTEDSCETVDLIVFLVVFDNNGKPVFLVEVKDDNWVQHPEYRFRSDNTYANGMHLCFTIVWSLVSGASASLAPPCACIVATRRRSKLIRHPFRVQGPSFYLVFLADGWNVDILSQDGFTKMKQMITDIFTHKTSTL